MAEEEFQTNEEKKCDCGYNEGSECNCQNEAEYYDCGCSKIEKLFIVSAIANILTTVFVAIIAGLMIFNFVNLPDKREHAAQKEIKAIFDKESMTVEEAMQSDKYALVLFYADWCPHCQRFAPTFKKLAKDKELLKTYNFVRVNSEDPRAIPHMENYNVQAFPSLFLVNPKTDEKIIISNNILFQDDAKPILKDLMNTFAKSRDKK